MASEITAKGSLTAKKGLQVINAQHSATIDMAGDDMIQASQVIGTTWEALNLGEISGTPGAILVINGDATNYVQLATANDDTGVFAKLLAQGCPALFPPNSGTIYAKANTAACRVLIACVEA